MDMCKGDSGVYVCITHKQFIPCDKGDNHLVSNWQGDIDKILEIMESENG